MITTEDILNMNFYKKEKFTGSDTGMRYRMEMTKREVPKEDGADGETVEETVLTVTSWPEPYGYWLLNHFTVPVIVLPSI